MFRLAGNCRRELGKKVLDMKGNAVLACKQYFDLEASRKIITVRSIGTAVRMVRIDVIPRPSFASTSVHTGSGEVSTVAKSSLHALMPISIQSPQKSIMSMSYPDNENDQSFGNLPPPLILPHSNWRSMDPVFLTIDLFPVHSIRCTGGFVCATSIKLLDSDESELRESWWTELRDEVKGHAKKLNCNAVLGYSEGISILDEVAVLFVSGTACQLNMSAAPLKRGATEDQTMPDSPNSPIQVSPPVSHRNTVSEEITVMPPLEAEPTPPPNENVNPDVQVKNESLKLLACRICHISYNRQESPFPMTFVKCKSCRSHYVPEILLTTIEIPDELEIIGNGVLVEAHGILFLIQFADRKR